jgi:hypothetical protein
MARTSALVVQASAAVVASPAVRPVTGAATRLLSRTRESDWSLASVALVTMTLAAMIVSVQASVLRLDSYGLVACLSPIFILGLVVFVVAGLIGMRDSRLGPPLMLAYGFLFAAVVWVTPLLMEGTPHFRSAYQNYGYVDPILRGYGLIPGAIIYHNWPVFPLLMAAVVDITHVPPLTLIGWWPIAMVLAYAGVVVCFVAILGRRVETKTSLVLGLAFAAWSYFVFDWTEQEYFSPQALGYLEFLVLLCVLAWASIERQGVLTVRITAAVVGLFTLIVATHVLTALMTLGILFMLIVTRHIARLTLLITCGLIFIVWQVTIGAPFFVYYSDQLMTSVLGISNFWSSVGSRVRGDAAHLLITEIRVVASALPYALAGLVVLASVLAVPEWRSTLRAKRLPDVPRAVSFPVAATIGTVMIAPASAYGGEMLIRVLFFSLPSLCALIAYGVRQKWFRGLMLAVLVVMAPVHLLTEYGNEQLDYVSPGEIAGMEYLSTLGPANVLGGFPAASTFNMIQFDARNAFLFAGEPTSLEDYADPWLHHTWVHTDWPLYVAVSSGDTAAMDLFTDRPDFTAEAIALMDGDPDYERIYTNPDFVIFLWTPSAGATPTSSDSMISGAYAEQKAGAPLPLILFCTLGIGLALLVELCAGMKSRPRAQAFARRMTVPAAALSLAVIAVSGYHVATLIGLIA